jgi:methyl-accepting chemotaxis protein
MKFDQMKIATRLRMGLAVMVVMLVLVSVVGISCMAANQHRMEEITRVNNKKSKLAIAMRETVYETMVSLRSMALSTEQSAIQADFGHLRTQRQHYAGLVQAFNQLFAASDGSTGRVAELLKRIAELERAAAPLGDKAAALAQAGQIDQVYAVLTVELAPVQAQWMAALGELIAFAEHQSEQAVAEAKAAYEHARLVMLVIGGLAVAAAMAVSIVISRSLLRQLGGELAYAMTIAERISSGDLTLEVVTVPGDRSSLLAAMKSMCDNLAGIVANVRNGTEKMVAASGEIAQGNFDLSARTEEQASALQHTTVLMKELTGKVKQNAGNAKRANDMVNTAAACAGKGGEVVAGVVDTMKAISASASEIVDIIGVIDGIAFQTNILALNAAVEAARAGEQGRGFAVVAAEVRALAQRSAGAAKEIKALINDSVEKVGAGALLADQTGGAMAEIVAGVQRVAGIMADIATASDEQNTGIAHVGSAMSSMDAATRQNAALVEAAAAAASQLKAHAETLADEVRLFKIKPAAGTALVGHVGPVTATRRHGVAAAWLPG